MTNEDLDLLAKIYGTDLYGLINILLEKTGKEEDFINELNKVRALFTEIQDGEENPEVYTMSMYSVAGGRVELTGTDLQHKAFQEARKRRDEELFPSFLGPNKLIKLALDCGLSVKE